MPATPRQRILAVLRKELADLGRNRAILGAMAALPLVFVTLMIALNAVFTRLRSATEALAPGQSPFQAFVPPPELSALGSPEAALLVLLNDQFMFFLLLVPVILPTVIAAHSIVGERQARTLEPLLATPVAAWELLVAKVASAVIPSVLIGWLAYALALGGVYAVGGADIARFLVRPLWSVGVPLVGPLLALASTLVSVVISSRVSDVRTAQAIAGATALPLIGGGMSVLVGQTVLGTRFLVVAVTALAPLDLLLLLLAIRLFRRELVLTRWN